MKTCRFRYHWNHQTKTFIPHEREEEEIIFQYVITNNRYYISSCSNGHTMKIEGLTEAKFKEFFIDEIEYREIQINKLLDGKM